MTVPIVKTQVNMALDEAEKKEVREAFDILDETGSGYVKREDIKIAIRALGLNPTHELLNTALNAVLGENTSRSRQDIVDFQEFVRILDYFIAQPPSEAELKRYFNNMDIDKNGGISASDLSSVARELGIDTSIEYITKIIVYMKNKQEDFDFHMKEVGEISESEYIEHLSKYFGTKPMETNSK